MIKISAVIPARDEEANVEKMVKLLLENFNSQILEIIVVNDCSTDKTGEILERLAKRYKKLHPVHRRKNGGVGNAIRKGLESISDKTEYVLMLDCDFVENVCDIKKLLKAASKGDGVLGSRYMKGGRLNGYPLPKKIANRAFHLLAKLFLGLPNVDVTNNFRLYKYEVINSIKPFLKSRGFSINAEAGLYPHLLGYKLYEIPVTWYGRTQDMGKSAFNVAKAGPGYISVFWGAVKFKYSKNEAEEKLQDMERNHFNRLVQETGETYYGNLKPVAKVRFSRKASSILSLLGGTRDPRILEIGCGTGILSEYLLKQKPGLNITGIDISPKAIKVAKKKLSKYKNASFKVGDALHIPYPKNYFNLVMGNSVLHHVQLSNVCKEVHRVLKPGGQIWFCEPNSLNPQIAVEKNIPIVKSVFQDSASETAFFRWSLSEVLQKSGFKDVSVRPYEFLHPLLPKFGLGYLSGFCMFLEKIPGVREFAGTLMITGIKHFGGMSNAKEAVAK